MVRCMHGRMDGQIELMAAQFDERRHNDNNQEKSICCILRLFITGKNKEEL